jgi:hypothetical protein
MLLGREFLGGSIRAASNIKAWSRIEQAILEPQVEKDATRCDEHVDVGLKRNTVIIVGTVIRDISWYSQRLKIISMLDTAISLRFLSHSRFVHT